MIRFLSIACIALAFLCAVDTADAGIFRGRSGCSSGRAGLFRGQGCAGKLFHRGARSGCQ